ncbi:MAG: hypothetical protein VBE63_09625 [Lamprobacter sp.]|uniref:hypothetical protein n=1 Tax=Lamprobacter sp. TaxID=3100796 RepID=UPI002B25BA09|nr:hypothetical protein [Lamprobacter sp.]MEA3640188.1 hypothetical protein [Lamprobacter sp.]
MRKGYLLLETQPDLPGLVTLSTADGAPQLDRSGLRFAARFEDVDTAFMHLHEGLRRHLNSLEPRTYRVDLETAVAAADAVELDHRRVFIEPQLAASSRLDERIKGLHRRHRRFDLLMQMVGLLALLVLALLGLVPF